MPERETKRAGWETGRECAGGPSVDAGTPVDAADEPALDPATELPAPGQDEAITGFEATPAGANMQAASEPPRVSKTEYEQLQVERDQLVDRLARLQAEFDNARKRAEREKAEFRDFATGNVVEKFLPVIDNFELALKSNGTAEQLRSGVELIVKQMEEILRQMQVAPIVSVGEAFDPRLHEALGSVERGDLPDQHVAEEIRRGYRLRDKLLRPALVRVAHNSKQVSE